MTNEKKTKKQLGKALAVLMTLGSLLGITAGPTIAFGDEFDVSVNVTAPEEDPGCETLPGTQDDPYWSPSSPTYPNGQNVDLSIGDSGLVDFAIDLGFVDGAAYDGCLNMTGTVSPTGTVVTDYMSIDNDLTLSRIDCDTAAPCAPVSSITGTLDASAVASTGTKYGKVYVTWTP